MENSLIFNFCDSQGQVYDYVFYNNTNYKKYINKNSPGWRSGWSLRGLNKPEHENIKDNSFRHAIIACSTRETLSGISEFNLYPNILDYKYSLLFSLYFHSLIYYFHLLFLKILLVLYYYSYN